MGAGAGGTEGEDGASMWVQRNELRSALEESARRLHVYEKSVYDATNVAACSMARDMWQSEHDHFVCCVRDLRELLEQWSDESM